MGVFGDALEKMLQITVGEIQQQLADAQSTLERNPEWGILEAVGRCLHWLRDPTAPTYFRQAALAYPAEKLPTITGALTVGNLYRLAGDQMQAQTHFTQGYQQGLFPNVQENPYTLQPVLKCCYFLGDDAEVERLAQRIRAINPTLWTPAFYVEQLAQARQTRDATEVQMVAEALSDDIYQQCEWLAANAGPTLWDWYEVAHDLFQELTNGTAPFDLVLPSTNIVRVTWQAGQWVLIEQKDTHRVYQAETAGEMANDLFHKVFVFDTREQVDAFSIKLVNDQKLREWGEEEWED